MVTVYTNTESADVARFTFYPETIPEELKRGRAWLNCDVEKVPYVAQLRGERLASSTNPDTWRSFSHAAEAWAQGLYAGVGRVIEADGPYYGVDLDDCRNSRTGELTPWALEVLGELDSYTEVSPSGTGVKVWLRAGVQTTHIRKEGENPIEAYYGGRYFTVTGQLLPQYSAEIEERTDELEALIAGEFPQLPPKPRREYTGPSLGYGAGFTIEEFLAERGIKPLAEVPDAKARVKYRIVCDQVEEHTRHPYSGTYVGEYHSGALFYHCWHGHCHGRGWREFRKALRKAAAPKLTIKVSLPGYTGSPIQVEINHG
jgi:hypothetical protein